MANTAQEVQILQSVTRKVISQSSTLLGDGVTTRVTTTWRSDLWIDPVTNVSATHDIVVVEDAILANINPGGHTTP